MVTVNEAINQAAHKFSRHGISNARFNAEVLLAHLLKKDRAWLITHSKETLESTGQQLFEDAVRRRVKREPLQYIIGSQEFWGLEFTVTSDVLIPRPETELIVEAAITAAQNVPSPLIVDLCTGSGCIAVSLAKELPAAQIFALDLSEKALVVARENARTHGVTGRIRFLDGDLLEPLEELDIRAKVDMIVTNPPYVRTGDRVTLQPEVRDYEPAMALFAGPLGTDFHQRIIASAPEYLKQHGRLIMEMGLGQAEALVKLVRESKAYGAAEVLKDLAGIERVIVAQKNKIF